MATGYLTAHDYDEESKRITRESTIDGYTPKNKKCFCYPYCYLQLTNNSGEEAILKWENFTYDDDNKNIVRFTLWETGSTQPCYTAFPRRYEGLTDNVHYSVSYNNFPQLPWSYDVFSNWFALHENSTMFGMYGNMFSAVTDALMGNIGGAVSGAANIAAQSLSMMDMKKKPLQQRGNIQGNFLMHSGEAGIYVNQIVAKAEYIHMIDDFFSHYGYLVNETKIPTFHKRPNYDYIKTRDINIVGDIPNEDIEELENIFNDGVTIWHNANTYGNYDVNNAPT